MMMPRSPMILVFDTETSGLPNWRMGPNMVQPGLCQFAAGLYDAEGVEHGSVSLIVKPRHLVTDGAAKTHGLSQQICEALGVAEAMAVAVWDRMAEKSARMVAHNAKFDWLIMESARLAGRVDRRGAREEKLVCTMDASVDVVRIPPTEKMVKAGRGNQFKVPSLTELHHFLFGEGFEGAHDALVDVRACARCYFELARRGAVTL